MTNPQRDVNVQRWSPDRAESSFLPDWWAAAHHTLEVGRVQFLWGGAKPENSIHARTNACSPWSFFAALHFKLYCFAFFQPVEIELLKGATMEKHLLAVRRAYEPKSAVADDTFDCALHRHLVSRGNLTWAWWVNSATEITSRTVWGHCSSTQGQCQRNG